MLRSADVVVLTSVLANAAGKSKAVAAPVSDSLSAAADSDSKATSYSATAPQPCPQQEHQPTGQPNTKSPDTMQPSAALQASEGMSTVQSGSSTSLNKESSSQEVSYEDRLPSSSQSPVSDVSPPHSASQILVHHSPQAHRFSVPSSSASSPMQSPRPRSTASEVDSVNDSSSVSVRAATSQHSSRPESPSMQNRPSQSPSSQQAFSQQLRAALSPAAKPPLQSQVASSAAPSAPSSRPGSANTSQPATVMSDMIAAMSRPSSAGPKSSRASPQSAGGSRPASAGRQSQPILSDVLVSGSITPDTAAAEPLPQFPHSASAGASQPSQSPGAVSPIKLAAAALEYVTAGTSPSAAADIPDNSPGIKPVSAGMQAPVNVQDASTMPSSPPVTTPVRKPPGLPSPVPHLSGQASADLESVITSDRWPDQVSSKSETASSPCSPIKGMAVQSTQPDPSGWNVPLVSGALSGVLSDTLSDDGSQLSQLTSNSQHQDQSASAIAARLEREQRQQREQEAKHLASKQRAADRRRAEVAAQDARQQAEHAARAESKAKAREAKLRAEAQGRPIAGPFQGPVARKDPRVHNSEFRDHEEYEEAPMQAPKAYPAPGVRHVPAHPAPLQGAERHAGRPSNPAYNGSVSDYGDHSPGPDSDYGEWNGSDFDYPAPRGCGPARGGGRNAAKGRGGRGPSQGTFIHYACL